ncbi:MAG: hypothetical protein LBI73_01985 [Myroides sp.]|jgi:formylmethanofuran dehydrogenase subunit E|nr:hypothetical protein [Myroides sp.]
MKKRVVTIGVLMMSGIAFSQVGIGLKAPHRSALLELKANEGEYRGVLLPRVPLKDLKDSSFINKGDVASSLLIYNTATNNTVTPGFYYWQGNMWTRLINNQDIIDNLDSFPRNKVLSVDKAKDLLYLEDTKGLRVETPLSELNIITTITEADNGSYIYTNEAGDKVTIDITGSVINNIEEILSDTSVQNSIYNTVAAQGKEMKAKDASIALEGADKAVLNKMSISVANKGITTDKIAPGSKKQILITNAKGEVVWVDATDEVIIEAVKSNETVTVLVDKGDGTFLYYNEKAIGKDGTLNDSKAVKFDANTLKIVEKEDEKGVYVFYDGKTSLANPLMTISTRAKSIIFENNSTVIKGDNVQEVIENIITKIEVAQGKPASVKGEGILINGEKELGEAVLKEMFLTIADGAITTEKIEAGDKKQILITNAKGEVVWVDATDEVIIEAVKQNETITILRDNNNGTFTYFNEKAVDKKGQLIEKNGVKFDANTLRIVERTGEKEQGIYDFYDGMTSLKNPLMTISTRAKAIHFDNNSTVIKGDNVQDVIENIITKIEVAQGKPATLKGKGILINGKQELEDSVLKEMELTIDDGAVTTVKIDDGAVTTYKISKEAVTTEKIAPGGNKHLLVTKDGKVEWVPASDQIIKEVVKHNETITVLDTSADNGTFVYYSEKDYKDGVLVGTGTPFDANTLTIQDNGKGKYIFRDGKTKIGTPLAEIDILGTVIENITEVLTDVNVKEEIFKIVAAQGQKLEKADESIFVEGGDKAVLTNTKISVAPKGITTDKIAPGGDKNLLVTKGGNVEWVSASDEVIKELVKQNETVTLLVDETDGTFTYYNEKGIDANGNGIKGAGVSFNANTLKIEQKGTDKGVYVFYDGKTSVERPLMTINVVEDVINNISEIVENDTVVNAIYEKVAAKGVAATPGDSSIIVTGGEQAVLNKMQIEVAPQGITPAKIAPGEKKGQLLVTNASGEVQWVDATDEIIKEILKGNQVITELEDNTNGTFTYFNEADYDANGKRKPEAKGVTFDANTLTIKEELDAKGKGSGIYHFYDKTSETKPIGTVNVVASVVNNIDEILKDETVQNNIYTTVANKGKEITSTDSSIFIDGKKAVLNDVTININQDGVKTGHIAERAVTTNKINSDNAILNSVLTADGFGKASFKSSADIIQPNVQGDLKGESGVINITDKDGKIGAGENVLFGNNEVVIAINEGGIEGKHIGYETIKTDNLGDKTITEKKLNAKGADVGYVATVVDRGGTVSYLPITADNITKKGNILTDKIVSVDNGEGKVLANVTLGINDKSVIATKLNAEGATAGSVATANADGTVTYQNVNVSNISDKATLSTDGIVTVDGVSSLEGVLFKEAKLGIAAEGIGTTQLANEAVTAAKISSEGIGKDWVLVSGQNNEVVWKELGDFDEITSGDITTDNIIKMSTDGKKTALKNIELSIADSSITKGKLSSENEGENKVLVTDGLGGFNYVGKDDLSYQGQDLILANELEFLDGTTGKSAVISDTKIGVKDRGITTVKISSTVNGVNADANAVLTADGNGNVEYKKINDTAFEDAGANLLSDGSLNIPIDNKAVLKETKISIAESGVKTAHIDNGAVIAAKIGSEDSIKGTVLAADGEGKAVFQTLKEIAKAQGSSITSYGNSLRIAGNKAALEDINIDVADQGIKNKHIDAKAVTADKIGSKDVGAGLVLTSTSTGGAEFKSLGDVLGEGGKTISGAPAISVEGGNNATLRDVTIDITDFGVTNKKIGDAAVSTEKIKAGANNTLLGTDKNGTVKWMDSTDETIKIIFSANEAVTRLEDNKDGTFTYYNEKEVDSKGNPIAGAEGVKFDANTLSIDATTPGIYVFNDKLNGGRTIATIDVRASKIIFEGDTNIKYDNVEAAIIDLIAKIEKIENIELEKAPLSGEGILVNGNTSEADVVLKSVKLSIADEAVTTPKIKGGKAKQLLITNAGKKAEWVDGTNEIIKEIVHKNEKVTILLPKDNGTFVYYSEKDIDSNGDIIGAGVTFNANTLSIKDNGKGIYEFYDQFDTKPLAVIDIQGTIVNNIKELLEQVNVKEEIFKVIASQGKEVSGDTAIAVQGGEKAALNPMSISLKESGVEGKHIAAQAITEDKLFAGLDKKDYVPVVQADGTVKYQSMNMVVAGEMLSVDSSLDITGDVSKAVLQAFSLKVKEQGIGNTHIQNLAVTPDKINSTGANKGSILTADGSGNASFTSASEVVKPTMNGDLVSDNSLVVDGGENVLFGDQNKSVTLKINDGGVEGKHISTDAIENKHIVEKTIEASKLNAGTGPANRVATADIAGNVTYQTLSTSVLTEKGNITTDNIITVSDNGVGKVLADVTLSIAENSIPVSKFDGGNAPEGAVATVGANGTSVSYQLITSENIGNKGTISVDKALEIDNGVDKVLSDVTIGVRNKGITNDKIDDLAVTADKISSKGVGEKRVLITNNDDTVFWGELKDIVTNTAGNLTTDKIIEITKGNGKNTLLADTELSIAENSITKNKLSSKDASQPTGSMKKDMLLVTDGKGGFDYAEQGAVEVGGKDLSLGEALVFEEGSGINAVLVESKIDVKTGGITTAKLQDGAVSKAKISATGEAANAVLTADGKGKVSYEVLSSTAFEGKGADLKADGSIKVATGNKALLKETSIAIADSGVENKHIKANAVTNDKISSKVGTKDSSDGAVLAADGKGNTSFRTFEDLATTQGKEVKSTDGSLSVAAGNKATLQNLTINIADKGVKTKHIDDRQVTASKIGEGGSKGRVLTTNGQGGATFETIDVAMSNAGKDMQAGAGIALLGGDKAALKDVTISVADGGINTVKLADNAVTRDKIKDGEITNSKIAKSAVDRTKIYIRNIDEAHLSDNAVSTRTIIKNAVTASKIGSETATEGYVLTADGKGNASFKAGGIATKGELKGSNTINVKDGKDAILKDVTLEVKGASIGEEHLKYESVGSGELQKKAVQTQNIDDDAVGFEQLMRDAVYNEVIADKGVSAEKIAAEDIPEGYVLTADGEGGTSFKALAGSGSGAGDFEESETIEIAGGDGDGALFKDLKLEVKGTSIGQNHLTYDAVGTSELQDFAVTIEKISSNQFGEGNAPEKSILIADGDGGAYFEYLSELVNLGSGDLEESETIGIIGGEEEGEGAILKDLKLEVKEESIDTKHLMDLAVTSEKISSSEEGEDVEEGYVLTSDGEGGTYFAKPTGGSGVNKASMPKFFYLPAMYVDIAAGAKDVYIDVYSVYADQFTKPMASSKSGDSTLPVLAPKDFHYYVTYYDDDVFYDVRIDDQGDMHYSVDSAAKPTGRTFFNIVLEVKED